MLAKLAVSDADSRFTVSFTLAFNAFDVALLRGQAPEVRALLVEDYLAETESPIQSLLDMFSALGAREATYTWLNNAITADVPASAVLPLLEFVEVLDISDVAEVGVASFGYDGEQLKTSMNVSQIQSAGFDGNQGGRTNDGPIRLGFIEAYQDLSFIPAADNNLYTGHPGWLDSAGGTSRIKKSYRCNPTCQNLFLAASATTHGTIVTWVAAGSIEQGQDSAFSGAATLAQRRRSGMGKEVEVYYYRTDNSAGWVQALQTAVTDGVDVVNMSVGQGNQCNWSTDLNFFNLALANATTSGVLVVVSAGNDGQMSGCSMTYPSFRPEVIAVSGVDTEFGTAYGSTVRDADSSKGGLPILVSGLGHSHAGVTLAAPFCVTLNFAFPSGYDDDGLPHSLHCGTSFAAPAVAGTTALLKDWLDFDGWGSKADDPRILKAIASLQGDRWYGPGSSTYTNTGVSNESGFGRMIAHSDNNLTAPFLVGANSVVLSNGQSASPVVTTVMPAGVTQLKAAIFWEEQTPNDAADIVVSLERGCFTTLLAQDSTFNFSKKVASTSSTMVGTCVNLRIRANHIQTGQTRRVYYAYYYHSGSLSGH